MVKHIADVADYTATTGSGLVIVDFWAKWCGPCRQIAPDFENLSTQYTGITFAKVDVDKSHFQPVMKSQGVKCMPTFLFYKDGVKLDKFKIEGANLSLIQKNIQKFLEE